MTRLLGLPQVVRPKYIVRLTAGERTQLEEWIHTGQRAASVLIHARILLKADVGAGGPGWDDARIAEAVECGASTVYRVRQAFVERGLDAALLRKKPTGRQFRKLDGAQARALKSIAHPLRLKILCVIGDQEACVQEIVAAVGTSQSNISQHLAILREKDVLLTRKDANRVYYRVGDQRILQLVGMMREVFCGVEE